MFNYLAQVLCFYRILRTQPGARTNRQQTFNLLGPWGGTIFSPETPLGQCPPTPRLFVLDPWREQFPAHRSSMGSVFALPTPKEPMEKEGVLKSQPLT